MADFWIDPHMTGHHKDPWKNEVLILCPSCAGVIFKLYPPVWLRSLLIGCCHLLRFVADCRVSFLVRLNSTAGK